MRIIRVNNDAPTKTNVFCPDEVMDASRVAIRCLYRGPLKKPVERFDACRALLSCRALLFVSTPLMLL